MANHAGVDIIWQPQAGPQTRFLASTADEILYGGAAGGGKTEALRNKLLYQVHLPAYKGLLLRQSFPELQEIMDRCGAQWPRLGATWSAREDRWLWPSGASIQIGYFEGEKDFSRYQGNEYAEIAFDEVGNLPSERGWLLLQSRVRSTDPRIRKGMYGSANPGGPGEGWLARRFVDVCPPDGTPIEDVDPETGFVTRRAFVRATLEDNPILVRTDPGYIARLNKLPPTLRDAMRLGIWQSGGGLALRDLDEKVHLVRPFDVPDHWPQFGAFDWGYDHPFSFGWYAVDEAGRLYCLDTVRGRRLMPAGIAQAIREQVPVDRLHYMVAGLDLWQERGKAYGQDNTPTLAEQFASMGLYFQEANVARIAGLNEVRRRIAWRRSVFRADPADPGNPLAGTWVDGPPQLVWVDTPTNREVLQALRELPLDPKRREDALKVNADRDGQGGDDDYDQVRYACASRPMAADGRPDAPLDPFSPEAYAAQAARRVSRSLPDRAAAAQAYDEVAAVLGLV